MTGDAVKEIAELGKRGLTVEIDGETWAYGGLNRVYADPRPSFLALETLDGLVDYLEANVEGLDYSKLMISVDGPYTVSLFERFSGESKARTYYVRVSMDGDFEQYPFGQYLDTETFQVKLRSLFCDTPDLQALLRYTSKLTINDSISVEDDGVTQSASVKKGMSGARVENASFPPVVVLKPYRSFREIEQVESQFLFRMKAQEGKVPGCALYEADGGVWRSEAIKKIADYLKENISASITVIR